mgnify:CR=1 FL=1|tara:strand:+ start:128 stop:337 length:210 start_codon:yes stop_codon:yes gene_type:complete
MQDIVTNDKEVRLKCFGMAMNISQMQHQYDLQKWMQEGKVGPMPTPPQMIDFFTMSDDIFGYVSDESSE